MQRSKVWVRLALLALLACAMLVQGKETAFCRRERKKCEQQCADMDAVSVSCMADSVNTLPLHFIFLSISKSLNFLTFLHCFAEF